jgi:hypothetical protein
MLTKLAAHEAELLRQVGDNTALLRYRLGWLHAFVRDTDRKRRAGTDVDVLSPFSMPWSRNVFDAQDAINDQVPTVPMHVDVGL